MPFTITHIAAVTPVGLIAGKRLPFSALAIGSMICDVPVFFPWLISYASMHSFLGIVTHCLPVGLAVYYLFHLYLKRPLSTLLPRSMAVRLAPWVDREVGFELSQVATVAVCLVTGAFTHVFWDGFTHRHAWGADLIPALKEPAIVYNGRSFAWYELFQHGSSAVFLPPLLAAGLWWTYRQPISTQASQRRSLRDSFVLGVIVAIITLTVAHAIGVHNRFPEEDLLWVLRDSVRKVGIISMILALVYCLVLNIRQFGQHQQPE